MFDLQQPRHIPTLPIAPNAARVLQQQMSVAPRKRQLATKVPRVVKGQSRTNGVAAKRGLFDHLVGRGK
jgi:hypothetical protein